MLRLAIVGCGRAARIHLGRMIRLDGVRVVACADVDEAAARALAESVPAGDEPVAAFADHRRLLASARPDAVAIFTPHHSHYHLALDVLQAGCHLFIEKPLSTNAQEASDIVQLARSRDRRVGVGHQYRLRPGLVEAHRRIREGALGPLRLVTAALAAPWLAAHTGERDAWRYEPKLGGGILADVGDHLLDALLWTTGSAAQEVAAFQTRHPSGLDLVTAAAIRLADGTPVSLGLSALAPGHRFELVFHGEAATLKATDRTLAELGPDGAEVPIDLPEAADSIDGDFVAAIAGNRPPCCPAEAALDTVRLIEAITRSALSGQVVRLA